MANQRNQNQGSTMTQTQGSNAMQTEFKREYKPIMMTGSQMIIISSLRKDLNLPPLSQHNIRNMHIDSASRMIDDLLIIREEIKMLNDTIQSMR